MLTKQQINRQRHHALTARHRTAAAKTRLTASLRRSATSPQGLALGVVAGVGLGHSLRCGSGRGRLMKNALGMARLIMPLAWLMR